MVFNSEIPGIRVYPSAEDLQDLARGAFANHHLAEAIVRADHNPAGRDPRGAGLPKIERQTVPASLSTDGCKVVAEEGFREAGRS